MDPVTQKADHRDQNGCAHGAIILLVFVAIFTGFLSGAYLGLARPSKPQRTKSG